MIIILIFKMCAFQIRISFVDFACLLLLLFMLNIGQKINMRMKWMVGVDLEIIFVILFFCNNEMW